MIERRDAGAERRRGSRAWRLPASLRPCVPATGSTLLELIVVLAIVALLFGVAIPALTARPTTASIRSSVDRARQVATITGRPVVTDSVVALPDGRLLPRRAVDAR